MLTFQWLLSRICSSQFQSSDLAAFESQSGPWGPFSLWFCFSGSHVVRTSHFLVLPWCWERAENVLVFPWEWRCPGRLCEGPGVCICPPQYFSLRARPCPALGPTALKTVLGPINVCKVQIESEEHHNVMEGVTCGSRASWPLTETFFFVRCWLTCLGFRKHSTLD